MATQNDILGGYQQALMHSDKHRDEIVRDSYVVLTEEELEELRQSYPITSDIDNYHEDAADMMKSTEFKVGDENVFVVGDERYDL